MRIDIYTNKMEYFDSMSHEELFEKCGKDHEMFVDFIRHIKAHPYVVPLDQYWIYVSE